MWDVIERYGERANADAGKGGEEHYCLVTKAAFHVHPHLTPLDHGLQGLCDLHRIPSEAKHEEEKAPPLGHPKYVIVVHVCASLWLAARSPSIWFQDGASLAESERPGASRSSMNSSAVVSPATSRLLRGV